MKIITEPTVYLVGRQQIDGANLNRFQADHDAEDWSASSGSKDAEELIEVGGRLCYMSFNAPRPGGTEAYLKHIIEVGHGSVLEHGVWNFIFAGISRTCSHELVRHRAGWGYSQLSQRYVDESVAEYVCPDIIAQDPEAHAIWVDAVQHSHSAYLQLVERLQVLRYQRYTAGAPFTAKEKTEVRKESRQAARSVLPNATETKIFCTANARAIRHFLEMRGSRHAEPEIRKLAFMVLEIMRNEAPLLFADYRIETNNEIEEIVTDNRKV